MAAGTAEPGLPGFIHEDTVMDGHRQGKKANAYKYRLPLTFLKWWSSLDCLKNIHCPCRDNSIPQPVPLLTNPASKLELPHVQTIPLLESDSSNLKIYSVANKKPMQIRKNGRETAKKRFFSNAPGLSVLNKLYRRARLIETDVPAIKKSSQ